MKNIRSYRLPALLTAVILLIGMLPVSAAAENVVGPIAGAYFYPAKDASFSYASGGSPVSGADEMDPNRTNTMTVTVPDSDGLPKNKSGEIWVEIPAGVKVSMSDAASCESGDVTCLYRPEKNLLVFKWKNEKKAGFTAKLTVMPDTPSTVQLGGRYVITTVKANQSAIAAMKAQTRNDKRLYTSAVTTFEGKLSFDDNNAYLWTFTRVTGDWYTISNRGSYLKMEQNALTLTDRENATIFHIRKEANGYVIEHDGYYLNTKSDNAANGMQGSNWAPMAQWVKLYSSGEVFDPAAGDKGYIRLNANGGNVRIQAEMLSAPIGETIRLPEYTGTKNSKPFIGWALYSNIYEYHDGTDSSYCEVYLPGTEYPVKAGQTTLYAVYNEKGTDVQFGIRIDGTIPREPANYNANEYTGHRTITNALRIGKWVVDVDGHKPVDGNHIDNHVTANLNALPTDAQLLESLKGTKVSYDPETMYVHWYVLKYSGKWKVDGVVRTRTSKAVGYDMNMEGESRNYIENMPKGFEFGQKATIAVGAEKDGDVKEPSLRGYEFTGWNTEADGSGTAYESGQMLEMTDSMTFYAQWTRIKTYQVIYDVEGSEEYETKAYMAGETVTLAAPGNKANHVFAGWSANGTKVNGSSFMMPAEDVRITAEYYGPVYIEITLDWPEGKAGYYGADVWLSSKVTGLEGMDYTLQWQYRDGDRWVDQPDAHDERLCYELTEETSGRVWRAIITDITPRQD